MEGINGSSGENVERSQKMGNQNLGISILLQEEEELQSTVQDLKEVARVIGKGIREREEEIRILTRRVAVAKLKAGAAAVGTLQKQVKDAIPLEGWGTLSPEKMGNSGLSKNENPKQEGKDDGGDAEIVNVLPAKEAVLIFPEEVWQLIFAKLTNPKDIRSCSITCPLFGVLLQPWKRGWVFFGEALPYIYRHLPKSKLLECRAICKTWNRAVDSFLEDHPSLRPHDPVKMDPRRMDIVMPTVEKIIGGEEGHFRVNLGDDFDNPSALVSIGEDGKFQRASGRNPFPGRAVEACNLFSDNRREVDAAAVEQWWRKLFNFMEVYGEDIYYLMLYCPYYRDDENEEKFLELFNSRLFQLLPNIRRLRITSIAVLGQEFPFLPRYELVLPPAPKLETLSFREEGHPYYGSPFQPILHRYHSQLRKLELPVHAWRTVSNLDWPNLTDLHLWGVRSKVDLRVAGIPRCLTKMGLCFEAGVAFQVLLDFINNLAAVTQLSTLRLNGIFKFGGPILILHSSGSVKTLELIRDACDRESAPTSCGKVIAAFPLIENVNVCVSDYDSSDFGIVLVPEDGATWPDGRPKSIVQIAETAKNTIQIIEVEKFMYSGLSPLSPPPGAMYHSNMWDMLPHLRVFTYQWNVYTREEYDEVNSKREPQF